ncbi:acetyl-CoA-benzylalcohol acetyltransferase-like [Populus alba]|uniref:acetyl-CoA-benzylalcohol acetyltransferase-like n=1 Tax=Populus alba TaxID=43335 RepID=UPI003CC76429
MKVQILARKLITPSSPTPLNLQKLKISCLDQNFPSNYYTSKKQAEVSSLIVTTMGQNIWKPKQSGCLSEFLKEGELVTELRNHLAPPLFQPEESPLLIVQFNMFECGGLAIGISVTHKIVDGFTLFTFVDSPSFQLSSFCPPKDMSSIKTFSPRSKRDNTIVEKRIVFNGAALSSLKAAAHVNVNNSGSLKYEPSRVQVVTAFIWRALIKASQARHGCLCPSYLTHIVDMRRRTALPIPGNMCGNFGTMSIAQFIPGDDSTVQLHDVVNRIHEEMSSTFSECAKASNGDDIISIVTNKMLKMKEIFETTEIDVYLFNSWSRFPIYEADFGWERPEWVSSVYAPMEGILLLDSNDGDGIEAWVRLKENTMLHFQQMLEIKY